MSVDFAARALLESRRDGHRFRQSIGRTAERKGDRAVSDVATKVGPSSADDSGSRSGARAILRFGATRDRAIVFTLLALLMALQLVRPGDGAFINDEPNLIGKALAANRAGHLAPHGLLGSLGVEYSPLCAWFYQLVLLVTSNALAITLIKTAIVWSCVWLALWSITRRVALTPWPLLLIPLSPFLWFYQRLLWDNVFLIPISAAMVATTLAFSSRPSAVRLAALTALAVLAFHVHVLATVPIVACALTVIVFRSAWLRAHVFTAVGIAAAALAVSAPYLRTLVFDRVESYHPHPSIGRSLAGALFGFRVFSHDGFEDFLSAFYRDLPGAHALPAITGWLVVVAGLAALATFVACAVRGAIPVREWTLERQLAFLAAAMVIGELVLFALLRLEPFWHYFNGVWLGYFGLLWWGFDRVRPRAWARAALALAIAAVGVLTLLFAEFAHAHHGDRSETYGAALADQIEVARELVERRPENVSFEVRNFALYPHALRVLVELERERASPTPSAATSPGRVDAIVKYARSDPDDGSLSVQFTDASATPGAQRPK
jgi:hypothetical protein